MRLFSLCLIPTNSYHTNYYPDNMQRINPYNSNFNFTYRRNMPGLIFILCDLSAKMNKVAQQLELTIRSIVEEYLNGCIYGVNIANRIYITLIGYGNTNPHIIKQGWACEWIDTVINAHNNNISIIIDIEKVDNDYDCESVWIYTKDLLDEMVSDVMDMPNIHGLGSPIIYNITSRMPMDKNKCIQFISDLKDLRVISRTHNSSAFPLDNEETFSVSTAIINAVLLDKYDDTQDVFLPYKGSTFGSRTISFWVENSTEIESDYFYQIGLLEENSSHVKLFAALHEGKLVGRLVLQNF